MIFYRLVMFISIVKIILNLIISIKLMIQNLTYYSEVILIIKQVSSTNRFPSITNATEDDINIFKFKYYIHRKITKILCNFYNSKLENMKI